MADFTALTGEGFCQTTNEAAWATVRNATSAATVGGNVTIYSSFTAGPVYNIIRGFLPFDTSSIPDGDTIVSATLKLYRDDSIGTFYDTDSTSIEIVQSSQADTSSLATGDIDNITFVSGGTLNFSSTSNNTYAEIPLNATGLSYINTAGDTKLAIITGRDLNNSAPTGYNWLSFQDRADANKPTLVVTTSSGGTYFFMSV